MTDKKDDKEIEEIEEIYYICLNCGKTMVQRKCKVVCDRCGYYMGCSDFY